jgi:hypothetical protein
VTTLTRIEPIIYETVVIKSTMGIKKFMKLIQDSNKPPNFFDVHVKHLFIYDSAADTNLSGDDILLTIKSCKSIVLLALWINQCGNFTVDFPQPHIMIPEGSLFRLSTWASSLAHGMSHHLYRNLTHFEVIVGGSARQRQHYGWDSYRSLQSLTRLTHLSIREVDPRPVLEMHDAIVPYLPNSIKIFVIRVHGHHVQILEKDWIVYQSDRRMVILVNYDEKRYGDIAPFIVGNFSWTTIVKDWGFLPAGAPGGIWDMAERALEARLGHLEEIQSETGAEGMSIAYNFSVHF